SELQRVNGVGDVNVFGARDYAMRIWLQPEKMAAYGLIPTDVTAALREQSLEAAAGSLGENDGEAFSYVIKYGGRFKTEAQYSDIIIKALGNGQFLKLSDVADIELGSQSYAGGSITNGLPAVNMGIFQTKGSNARDIIIEIEKKLEEIKSDLPKGVEIFVPYNTNTFLNASIEKVVTTLAEAFLDRKSVA